MGVSPSMTGGQGRLIITSNIITSYGAGLTYVRYTARARTGEGDSCDLFFSIFHLFDSFLLKRALDRLEKGFRPGNRCLGGSLGPFPSIFTILPTNTLESMGFRP